MYSPLYYYFNIQSDEKCTQYIESDKLLNFLLEEVKFIESSPNSIKGNDKQPWLNLCMVIADEIGSYASTATYPEKINLIPIVGSKNEAEKEEYIQLLTKIAKWLKWELIEEEDDEGNENVVHWSPHKKINNL